jgi:hypothetical protein
MPDELHERDFADEKDAARFLGVTPQTLRGWRHWSPPVGPPFLTILGTARYPIAALKAWAAANPPKRTQKMWLKYPVHRKPPEPQTDIFDIFMAVSDAEQAERADTFAPGVESVNPFPFEKG